MIRPQSKPVAGMVQPVAGEFLGVLGVFQEFQDRVGQTLGGFFGDQESGHAVLDDVGDSAHGRGDHRLAVGERLDRPDAQPLGVAAIVDDRRVHVDVAALVIAVERGVVDEPEELDDMGQAESAR